LEVRKIGKILTLQFVSEPWVSRHVGDRVVTREIRTSATRLSITP
jgi:hypothetical protein